jgi:hypothetical protein
MRGHVIPGWIHGEAAYMGRRPVISAGEEITIMTDDLKAGLDAIFEKKTAAKEALRAVGEKRNSDRVAALAAFKNLTDTVIAPQMKRAKDLLKVRGIHSTIDPPNTKRFPFATGLIFKLGPEGAPAETPALSFLFTPESPTVSILIASGNRPVEPKSVTLAEVDAGLVRDALLEFVDRWCPAA